MEDFNLDTLAEHFRDFLQSLLETYEPIGGSIFMGDEYSKKYAEVTEDWSNKIQGEIDRTKIDFTETQIKMFLKEIDPIHKEYNHRFQALINKAKPTEINGI